MWWLAFTPTGRGFVHLSQQKSPHLLDLDSNLWHLIVAPLPEKSTLSQCLLTTPCPTIEYMDARSSLHSKRTQKLRCSIPTQRENPFLLCLVRGDLQSPKLTSITNVPNVRQAAAKVGPQLQQWIKDPKRLPRVPEVMDKKSSTRSA